ncbi:uncharacterized protein LOC126791852 [Argentina anserina]|uniref:uncharacterized protein LOC126791852 n=1 Tax=Argentina anserina TaxID=57926 RepID=UPI00217686A8|nr:uncharacterized protein LOC126791852 [Potentilla anserina]
MADEATVDLPLPERSSIPSGDHSVWADVSPLLDAACKDLQDGMLIHGDNFNLFAAMSALEIMDPKMDSGIVCKYYSVDEAIEDGAAPVPISSDRTVDVQCTIDIMDHLLACEATWHKGHSLAQTVFSCIYLLRPDRTSSDALLHSYCKVVRVTCKTVISVVSDARTHEEEDLFTMSYGLALHADGDDKCLSMLNAVEETVNRQLRACKAPSSKRTVLEDFVSLQTNLELEEAYCKALLCRLRFRKYFYHVITCMRRPQGRGLELARKHIASCISELQIMLNSSEFLRSRSLGTREGSIEDKTTASGCQAIGFDASLNSRLSAPTPPRTIKILSWKKTIEYFMKLLHDLDVICSYLLEPSLESVLHFVVEFQKSLPDLVARAHLQRLLVEDGKLYGRDPIFGVITRAAAVPHSLRNHDMQKHESIVHLVQLVINLLKILCTNSAWQRRKLGKILQDWRVVYIQLEMAFRNELGENTNSSNDENACMNVVQHILVWVEEQTYWIAARFLILGFELELYSQSEYCMVYWYIYVVLIKVLEKKSLKMVASNDSGRRKGKKKRDSGKDVARDIRIPPAILFLQCQICIAEGLAMMLAALRNEHMMVQHPSPFNTEHERFSQHFELLQKACIPDQVSYPLFKDSTTHTRLLNLVRYDHFKDAQKIVKEVKSSFSNNPEKSAELRRLEQVAEHNSIALNIISRAGARDPSLKVSFEFNHHPCFATAVVKRS